MISSQGHVPARSRIYSDQNIDTNWRAEPENLVWSFRNAQTLYQARKKNQVAAKGSAKIAEWMPEIHDHDAISRLTSFVWSNWEAFKSRARK